MTEPTIAIRKTIKNADSAAHIVLRCHGVGYLLMQACERSCFRNNNARSTSWLIEADRAWLRHLWSWWSWYSRSSPPVFCFEGRARFPSAMLPMPVALGLALDRYHRCVRTRPDHPVPYF